MPMSSHLRQSFEESSLRSNLFEKEKKNFSLDSCIQHNSTDLPLPRLFHEKIFSLFAQPTFDRARRLKSTCFLSQTPQPRLSRFLSSLFLTSPRPPTTMLSSSLLASFLLVLPLSVVAQNSSSSRVSSGAGGNSTATSVAPVISQSYSVSSCFNPGMEEE